MLPPEILKHAKDGKALALELLRLDRRVERFGYSAIVREVLDADDPPLLIAMVYFTKCISPETIGQSLIDEGNALHARGFPEAEYATWTARARAFLLRRILN